MSELTELIDLIVVERGGARLAVPAARITAVDELPAGDRAARLQQRLGQPPVADDERCFALHIAVTGGDAVVPVAGRVSITAVASGEIATLPPLLAGVAPVTAVVFAGDASLLVLDVDAIVAHARAGQ